jgi:hypothetical protein
MCIYSIANLNDISWGTKGLGSRVRVRVGVGVGVRVGPKRQKWAVLLFPFFSKVPKRHVCVCNRYW